jgi:hypothetical protein
LAVEEFLAYFRDAIERPEAVQRWPEWWAANAERVRQTFDHADYVRLKFRRLDAARRILERLGRPAVEPPEVHWLYRIHCPHCGEPLMKFVPGDEPTREEVVAFGHRSGIEQCQQGYPHTLGVFAFDKATQRIGIIHDDAVYRPHFDNFKRPKKRFWWW